MPRVCLPNWGTAVAITSDIKKNQLSQGYSSITDSFTYFYLVFTACSSELVKSALAMWNVIPVLPTDKIKYITKETRMLMSYIISELISQ